MKEYKELKPVLNEAIEKGFKILEDYPGWDEIATFTDNCIALCDGLIDYTADNAEMIEHQAEIIIRMYAETYQPIEAGISRAEAVKLVNDHNQAIYYYKHDVLPGLLGCKSYNDRISFDKWVEANRLYKAMNFYSKGRKIQELLRGKGYDVKMDMQTYELVIKEYRK